MQPSIQKWLSELENGMSHIMWELRTAARKLGNACTRSMSTDTIVCESVEKECRDERRCLLREGTIFKVHTSQNKTKSWHLHSTIHNHPHWIGTSKPDPASFWNPLGSATACHYTPLYASLVCLLLYFQASRIVNIASWLHWHWQLVMTTSGGLHFNLFTALFPCSTNTRTISKLPAFQSNPLAKPALIWSPFNCGQAFSFWIAFQYLHPMTTARLFKQLPGLVYVCSIYSA